MKALTDATLVILGVTIGYAVFLDTGLTLVSLSFVVIGVTLAVSL